MPEKRTRGVWFVAALLLLTASLSAYTAAYFFRSKVISGPSKPSNLRMRLFSTRLETAVFKPAAKVESLVTGKEVLSIWLP